MNPKHLLVAIVLLGILTAWTLSAQREIAAAPGNARFLITPVETTTVTTATGQNISVHTAFKIDTETGRTWKYDSTVQKDGKAVDGWIPISDLQRW